MIKRTLHRILGYKINIFYTMQNNIFYTVPNMPIEKVRKSKCVRCWLGADCVLRAWWGTKQQVALMSDGSVVGLPAGWNATWEPVTTTNSESRLKKLFGLTGRKIYCGLHLIWFFMLMLFFGFLMALDNLAMLLEKKSAPKSSHKI